MIPTTLTVEMQHVAEDSNLERFTSINANNEPSEPEPGELYEQLAHIVVSNAETGQPLHPQPATLAHLNGEEFQRKRLAVEAWPIADEVRIEEAFDFAPITTTIEKVRAGDYTISANFAGNAEYGPSEGSTVLGFYESPWLIEALKLWHEEHGAARVLTAEAAKSDHDRDHVVACPMKPDRCIFVALEARHGHEQP